MYVKISTDMITRIFDEPSKDPLPQEPGLDDHRLAVIKGSISSIPIIGGVLAEEFGLILAPVLSRRRDEWFSDLARRLHGLAASSKELDLKRLSENEAFVSAVIETTQIAIKTHATEKLAALRNAVLNIAIGAAPDEDVQAIFLRLIDSLTPSHLRLLRFLQQPSLYVKGGLPEQRVFADDHTLYDPSFHQLIATGLPDAFPSAHFISCLLRDLYSAGLQSVETGGGGIPYANRFTTGLGDEFLKFIESPI